MQESSSKSILLIVVIDTPKYTSCSAMIVAILIGHESRKSLEIYSKLSITDAQNKYMKS